MPKFKNWKQEDVNNALRRVDLGELSIREAATVYGVPKSTLHDKLSHKSPFVSKQGPKPYLTRAEEEVITGCETNSRQRRTTKSISKQQTRWVIL